MKTWFPRIWIGLLFVLVLISIPSCLNLGSDEHPFMNWTGQQSTFDAKGPLAAQQLHTFYVTLWVTGFLLVVVGGAFCYALWRFRLKKTDDPNAIPKQAHGHPLIEVGLVAASAGLLVIIAIPTFQGIILMKKQPKEYQSPNAVNVTVTGYQWWFNFEYEDEGFYSSNELVFPVGEPVNLKLVTNDVIHSFWLPKLSGKTDLIAGQENHMWIQADEPGYFWGQCAEYCGDSHAYMLFRAKALPMDEYKEWVRQQKAMTVNTDEGYAPLHMPPESDAELVSTGAQVFAENCVRCHSMDPKIQTMGAPNLAHFASRSSIAAGWLENEWKSPEENPDLAHWLLKPDEVKPGNNMWRGFMMNDGKTVQMEGLAHADLTEDEVHALVAYLYTLRAPNVPARDPETSLAQSAN
jgi:cytochrome c oxidase subunit 2